MCHGESGRRLMVFLRVCFFGLLLGIGSLSCAQAAPATAVSDPAAIAREQIAPHRALYDIRIDKVKSGSQILGVRGKMLYTLRKTCSGWITDHRFNMFYEYSSAEPMEVETRFSSFENFEGTRLDFSSARFHDGEMAERIRGRAALDPQHPDTSSADFMIPADVHYDLSGGTFFPISHTWYLIDQAKKGRKIVHAVVFDGSDDKGPVEINAVIGRAVPRSAPKNEARIDIKLLDRDGWAMDMAVFSRDQNEAMADYELTMDVLDNGIVRDMKVDYHDFAISQKLTALESIKPDKCEE